MLLQIRVLKLYKRSELTRLSILGYFMIKQYFKMDLKDNFICSILTKCTVERRTFLKIFVAF